MLPLPSPLPSPPQGGAPTSHAGLPLPYLRLDSSPVSTSPKRRPVVEATRPSLEFSGINGILFAAAVVALALGYFLLARGDHTAAPLLLALGYVVLLPLAIIL